MGEVRTNPLSENGSEIVREST